MDPLAVMESHLGSVERWPSRLLMDMFAEESKAGWISMKCPQLQFVNLDRRVHRIHCR